MTPSPLFKSANSAARASGAPSLGSPRSMAGGGGGGGPGGGGGGGPPAEGGGGGLATLADLASPP